MGSSDRPPAKLKEADIFTVGGVNRRVNRLMNRWLARLIVALLLPFGLVVLCYWLIQDWLKSIVKP